MPGRFIVLGNPENRRVELFRAAYVALGLTGFEVLAWCDFIRDSASLRDRLEPGSALRIESPGENFEVERAILALGADPAAQESFAFLPASVVETLTFEQGRILPMRQWYLGWRTLLRCLGEIVGTTPDVRSMNSPAEISAMFDKAHCHERFAATGVPTPPLVSLPESFDELIGQMVQDGTRRVFIKPAHSSSASGVVALEISGSGIQAHTSVELVRGPQRVQLYNSLRIRRYTTLREVRELVDAICAHRCIAEEWFPKAGFNGKRLDLRVLVLRGKAAHTVVRQSAGPITNLHLGNSRGDLARLRSAMGDVHWRAAMTVCEQAAACFPQSLYVGVDLLVSPSMRRFAVAEVNAFGDLLPNLLHQGVDTYSAELQAFLSAPLDHSTDYVSTNGL